MRKIVLSILAAALILPAGQAGAAEAEDVIYSVLFPGLGQIRAGRYTRGTVLLGVELVSLGAIAVTNLQYDRKIEAYERSRILYESATYIGDASSYHADMVDAWEEADDLHGYRKVLIGTAIGVWAIGVADMIWGPDAENPPVTMEVRNDGFLVCKNFSF